MEIGIPDVVDGATTPSAHTSDEDAESTGGAVSAKTRSGGQKQKRKNTTFLKSSRIGSGSSMPQTRPSSMPT